MNNLKVETMVFVTYNVEQIVNVNEHELYMHLLDKVWGEWCSVEEDIRLICNSVNGEITLTAVRYQFGSELDAEERCEAVGKLITEALNHWVNYKSYLSD